MGDNIKVYSSNYDAKKLIMINPLYDNVEEYTDPSTNILYPGDVSRNYVNFTGDLSNNDRLTFELSHYNENTLQDYIAGAKKNYLDLSLNHGLHSLLLWGQYKLDNYPTAIYERDLEIPVITLSGDTEISLFVNDNYIEPGYSALDNIDGVITNKVVITGSVNTSLDGIYDISYDVTDSLGNKAITVGRKITVVEAPLTPNNNNYIYSFDGEQTAGTTISAPHLWHGFSADNDWSVYFKRTCRTQDGWDFVLCTPANRDWQNQPPLGIMAFNNPNIGSGDSFYIDWVSGVTSSSSPDGRIFAHFPFITTTPTEYEVLVSYNSERFNSGEQSAPDFTTDLNIFYNNGSGWTQAPMIFIGDDMTTNSPINDPLDQDLLVGPPERLIYNSAGQQLSLNTEKIAVSDVKLWNSTIRPVFTPVYTNITGVTNEHKKIERSGNFDTWNGWKPSDNWSMSFKLIKENTNFSNYFGYKTSTNDGVFMSWDVNTDGDKLIKMIWNNDSGNRLTVNVPDAYGDDNITSTNPRYVQVLVAYSNSNYTQNGVGTNPDFGQDLKWYTRYADSEDNLNNATWSDVTTYNHTIEDVLNESTPITWPSNAELWLGSRDSQGGFSSNTPGSIYDFKMWNDTLVTNDL